MSEQQKAAFVDRYRSAKRSMALMVALAIIFPIQLFLLGKVLLGILFVITGGGFGVWYIVEWFLTPGRVRDFNRKVASDILVSMGGAVSAGTAVTEEE
jgi:hypothetical protein